jgi:hypothetical protein
VSSVQTISHRNTRKLDQRSNKKPRISVDHVIPILEPTEKDSDSECTLVGDERIGFQVVKGTLNQVQLNENALVLSQGWPSWAFAIDGLGFNSITTIASFRSLTSRNEFQSTSLGKTLTSRSNLISWIERNQESGIIFVQGERKFLETIFLEVNTFPNLKLIFGCSDPTFWTCDGWRESHANAGGVTTGSWTFYQQNLELAPNGLPNVQRSLRHVLKTTEGGSSKSSLLKASFPPSGPDSRVRWNDKFPQVCTYSVFTKDTLVQRLVTDEELLDIYDLELSIQSELKRFWNHNNVTPTRSFVEQIPIKVLRGLGLRVVKALSPTALDHVATTSLATGLSYDSDSTTIATNCSNMQLKHAPNDDDSIAAEILSDSDDFACSSKSLSEPSDKAAKDDDAEAVSEDWDRWTVENFKNFSGHSPLVCTGTYSPTLHQPFFDGLRTLLIWRY